MAQHIPRVLTIDFIVVLQTEFPFIVWMATYACNSSGSKMFTPVCLADWVNGNYLIFSFCS